MVSVQFAVDVCGDASGGDYLQLVCLQDAEGEAAEGSGGGTWNRQCVL